MRYEDWDVLIFPGGGVPNAHIPLKEFRTSCIAVRDRGLEECSFTRNNSTGPLMHCFVPSLAENAPFQISVHSWSQKKFHYTPPENADKELSSAWQVKVFVDGVLVCNDIFGGDATWPKVLTSATRNKPKEEGQHPPLRFPRFYQQVMSQRTWTAHDNVGRIKVYITEGHVSREDDGEERFTRMLHHCIMNFQPAPMEVLQNAGIAWPNAQMYHSWVYMDDPPIRETTVPGAHSRNVSTSSVKSSPLKALPGPPPPTPNMDSVDSSRSTSAYSTIPYSALPMGVPPNYPGMGGGRPMEVRLPSDQFSRLISALKPADVTQVRSMPPPPLPVPQYAFNGEANRNDRRIANASDISMHPDYQSFPNCTDMDEQGHVVHHSPAQNVRSRKEGSLDMSNRDFLSNILNPTTPQSSNVANTITESTPAQQNSLLSSSPMGGGQNRKRTRASLKNLTVNDTGSPEKLDDELDDGIKQPARKVSMAVAVNKEHTPMDDEMVVDT